MTCTHSANLQHCLTLICSAGDIADQSAADMVIMSSEAVHAKIVDANLLAEFVPCPMLLLP